MTKKKILLIGNSSCVNRGDAAILDGLIEGINEISNNQIDMDATSVHYFESEVLLGYTLKPDFSYDVKPTLFGKISILKKIWNKYLLFYEILILALLVKYKISYIPKKFRAISQKIDEYDIVIQVGGSYFVDLYTPLKYVSLAISILLQKPVYIAGHSVGPFESWKSKLIPRLLFRKTSKIYLREEESVKHINSLSKDYDNFAVNADTAWLIGENKKCAIFHEEVKTNKPLVAITVRDLNPFDKRLGISQDKFESLFVVALNKIIEDGFHIVGISMGTGFGRYAHDDRIPALRIKSKLNNPEEMTVLMYEYNHLEVGYALSQCKMLIGTRLHSVILSLRYNTPAVAVFYEHKSLGILNKMGFGDNSFFIKEIGNDSFNEKVNEILKNQEKHKDLVREKVSRERHLGLEMLREIVQ